MPKKKNSYAFFIDHYVDEQRQKGRDISKRVASEECGPLWKALSDEKKKIYIDLADAFKTEKNFQKQKIVNQWNDPFCKGSNVFNESKSGNEIAYMNAHIRHEKALRSHNFYIIHCNYYCRTEEGIYVPAEIALVEFNLEEGIRQTYHTLVNPGKIPLGYAYEVRRVSDEIHGLPIPPHEEGEGNFDRILRDIYCFMKSIKENEDEYPPLFTIEENVRAATEILKTFSRDDSSLKVYPIHRMFFWLKNKCTEYCGNEPGFPVLSNAITEIEKDVFRYCTGISCKFHSELQDKFQSCSLSIVQRLVYIICDHCCRHLGIKLVKGKHIYENVVKRDDVSKKSVQNDFSDVASCLAEESDFCGASTYASSVVGDYRYVSGRKGYIEEEADDDNDVLSEKGESTLNFECDDSDDYFLMKVRGRGRPIRDDQP